MSTHQCQAYTSSGDPCPNHASSVMDVLQLTSTVYLSTMLPLRLQGGGWLATHMHVCGTHRMVLLRGKALHTNMRMGTSTTEESNTMNTMSGLNHPIHGDIGGVNPEYEAQVADEQATTMPKKQVKCGNKNCTNKGWHDTVQEVKACYGVKNQSGDWYERKDNVKKIKNPYPKR